MWDENRLNDFPTLKIQLDGLKIGFVQAVKDYHGQIQEYARAEIERQINEFDFEKIASDELMRSVPEVIREQIRFGVRMGLSRALRQEEIAEQFAEIFAKAVKEAYLDQ